MLVLRPRPGFFGQMRFLRRSRYTRTLVTSLLLVTFVYRVLIPAGFMPAPGSLFTLGLCPETFPAHLLMASHGHGTQDSNHHAGHNHDASDALSEHRSTVDHCPFGSASGTAPLAQWAIDLLLPVPVVTREFTPEPLITGSRLIRAQQARAPPTFS